MSLRHATFQWFLLAMVLALGVGEMQLEPVTRRMFNEELTPGGCMREVKNQTVGFYLEYGQDEGFWLKDCSAEGEFRVKYCTGNRRGKGKCYKAYKCQDKDGGCVDFVRCSDSRNKLRTSCVDDPIAAIQQAADQDGSGAVGVRRPSNKGFETRPFAVGVGVRFTESPRSSCCSKYESCRAGEPGCVQLVDCEDRKNEKRCFQFAQCSHSAVRCRAEGYCDDCPNIVVIMTDDQDTLLGGADFTPKIKQLIADKGAEIVDFRSHTPTCAPSRATFFSGRYPHSVKTDVPTPMPPEVAISRSGGLEHMDMTNEVWPHIFSKYLREEQGYASSLFGKCMNLECGDLRRSESSFDYFCERGGYYNRTFRMRYGEEGDWSKENLDSALAPELGAGYSTSFLGNMSVNWLEDHVARDGDRPFLLYLSLYAPHRPFEPAAWHEDDPRCADVTSPRTPNFGYRGQKPKDECLLDAPCETYVEESDFPQIVSCRLPITEDKERRIDKWARRRCETMLTVDDTVAELIEALERLDRLDNTYIMFVSDHGYNLGNHGHLDEKNIAYEQNLRVPFYIRGPHIPHGVKLKLRAGIVDIAPTILSMAGMATKEHMEGMSLLPALLTADGARRKELRQDESLIGSVRRYIKSVNWREFRRMQEGRTNFLLEYYNQQDYYDNFDDRAPARDDWSNTYRGVIFHHEEFGEVKYIQFDPRGKQTNFANVMLHQLFYLDEDPYEIDNVWTRAPYELRVQCAELVEQLYNCSGQDCVNV